jgi:hypothetical protein
MWFILNKINDYNKIMKYIMKYNIKYDIIYDIIYNNKIFNKKYNKIYSKKTGYTKTLPAMLFSNSQLMN